jgi:hypothetical protein
VLSDAPKPLLDEHHAPQHGMAEEELVRAGEVSIKNGGHREIDRAEQFESQPYGNRSSDNEHGDR